MAEEHRKRHKAHLDQHVRDVSGAYHYIGDWYVLSGGRRKLLPFALWCVLAAVCVILSGCVNFPGLKNTWYVILPYLGMVSMLFGLGLQAVRIISGGGRLKTFDFERTHEKVVPFAGALVIFAVLTAALGGVFLAFSGVRARAADALFFAPILFAAVCSRMAISAFRAQVWTREKSSRAKETFDREKENRGNG
jgi:hypothetical protein